MFANRKGFDVPTYAHEISYMTLNDDANITLSDALRTKLFSSCEGVVWNVMLLEGTFGKGYFDISPL